MSFSAEEILSNYLTQVTRTQNDLTELQSKINRFSLIRVGLLLVEIAAFIYFVSSNDGAAFAVGGIFLIVPVAIFIIVVKKQGILVKQADYLKQLLWIYENEVQLLNGLPNGYDHGSAFADDFHEYTADLDIFGKASLFSITNRCSTHSGNQLLASKLNRPAAQAEILSRQEAIVEIKEKIDHTYRFRAYLKGHDSFQIDQIKKKLKEDLVRQLEFVKSAALRFYVKVLPYLMPVLFIGAIFIDDRFWGILSILALLHAAIIFYFNRQITTVYYSFSGSAGLLAGYSEAIQWTEDQPWEATYVQKLFNSQVKVSAQIRQLAKIIQAFDARLNILLSAVLNFSLLWDLKCCIRLDQWHKNSFTGVENGLDRIGHFEELISFATLAHNHPQWTFPKINAEFSLVAKSMGHPLIPTDKRIDNGFQLQKTPTVDIITGSNMAGKSTFLRTLGINMVLAYAGGPVCAQQMELSIFNVVTYMRIRDSLNESTSTFKAELNRLKMILSHVAENEDSFVLIDEMLRGTNSRDKFLGSKVFIEKLIEMKTPTLFATHDLQLSDLEAQYPAAVRNFHFDIQINDGEMKFDYLIKSGPCSTFNATVLLKEIGLTITSA